MKAKILKHLSIQLGFVFGLIIGMLIFSDATSAMIGYVFIQVGYWYGYWVWGAELKSQIDC